MLRPLYTSLARLGNLLSHLLLLAIRLYWGSLLVTIGLSKWLDLLGTANFFETLNIPLPFVAAIAVASIEFFGGIALVLGLLSRLMALLVSIVLIGAYVTAHQEALMSIFTDPALFFKQQAFLFLYASLLVFCFGPGRLSLDALIFKNDS